MEELTNGNINCFCHSTTGLWAHRFLGNFYHCSIIEVLEHSVNLSTFSASLFKLSAAEMVPIKKCERSSVVCELLKSIVIIIIEKSTKLMTRQNFLLLNGWSITRIFKKQIL